MLDGTIGKTNGWRTALLACMVFAAVVGGGCTYDGKAVKAFLIKPRRPVSGVEYRVYPPDMITINSLHVPEISNKSLRLRPDGKINLPLLGELYVAGMTPTEIEKVLKLAADDYYEQVDATVTVSGYNSQKFYVFGQVGGQGPRPWTGRDTLLDVLATVRPNTLAWPERIIVTRAPEPQVGGRAATQPSKRYQFTGVHPKSKDNPPKKITINLMAMVTSGDLSNNILLMPNDVIYVQPNPLAKVGLAIQNLLFPIRPAIQTAGTPAQAVSAAAMP